MLLDWLIQLPAKLAVEINRELIDSEDDNRMPDISQTGLTFHRRDMVHG